MIITAALLSLSAAPGWIFYTQPNLLNQPEAVAEFREQSAAPGQYLKFSCSVLSGPLFEVGLGPRSFEEFAQFSAEDAGRRQTVALAIQPADGPMLSISAGRVAEQVTVHAYLTGGSEALAAAKAIAGGASVAIAAPDARAEFSNAGAGPAIGQVLEACPFKG